MSDPGLQIATITGLHPIDASPPAPRLSIVVPTYNHLEDLLKPCLESVARHTDLSDAEVVVVANGCTDGTEAHVGSLGAPFRVLSFAAPLGFTKATNEGIRASRGEYIVLLNNDTVLLPQGRNAWIEALMAPFLADTRVGISGPVKFRWDCGGAARRAIAFWCAMVKRELFGRLGLLDEAFSPGMGEDGDFSIKAQLAGYAIVRVPTDGEDEFGRGLPRQDFPIYHAGSGTFRHGDHSKVEARNRRMLEERYGRGGRLEEIYSACLGRASDISALLPALRRYAQECAHVTEFGVRGVFSTWAFLAARPRRVVGYDIERSPNVEEARSEAGKAGVQFEFRQEDVLGADIEETDLLFIDTVHTCAQLRAELARHAASVRRYILVHDTQSFGLVGQDGGPGEMRAIQEFLESRTDWRLREHIPESNGLTVLERGPRTGPVAMPAPGPSVSIVIPTCGKDHERVLQPCVEAVLAHTDMADKEVVVVANGCPGAAVEWLRARPVRLLEFPEPVGYIRAVNAGICAAGGEFVVTLDDDSFLQPQGRDQWVGALKGPFLADPSVGATGPFASRYPDLGEVLHSGCAMYRKADLLRLAPPLFDEAFNPGYLGDEDLALRLRAAGKRLVEVPEGHRSQYVDGFFRIAFPVVHTGTVNTMPKHSTDLPLVAKNRRLLLERHLGKGAGAAARPFPAGRAAPLVSVIIPTYRDNHRVDEATGERVNLLRRNLETLARYTDLAGRGVEVLVVCNGCKEGQEDYVRSLGGPFRALSFPEPLGFTMATNEGIKAASGEFLVLMNDDVEMLEQPRNQWLDWLLGPFMDDPKMGLTGPLQLHDDYSGQDVIIGFCLCVRRAVLDESMRHTGGLLDGAYSPGGGEDIDLCCRARAAGYKVRQVPREGKLGFSHTNVGEFMIWHVNNQTFKDIPEYTNWYVKRNGLINCKRHNRDIRLNLGSGGVEYPGYLSVDLHDRRASVIMDIARLDFEDASVSEVLAVHVFEHLSPYRADATLREWLRVLKPGGRLVMEMPDIEQLCARFGPATTAERYGILNAVYGSVNTTGEGEPSDITSPHLFGWWPQSVADHLHNAGFVDVRFGPEQFPHPEPPNMHVEAAKPLAAAPAQAMAPEPRARRAMKGLWTPPKDVSVPFGEDTTYRKAMEFLADCARVEDWGGGTGWAKRFMKRGVYVCLDGTSHKAVDAVVELAEYRSQTEGILLRHVLEHNVDWKDILENAVASFTKRLVIVVSTPLGPETREIKANWSGIPDISFAREDLMGPLRGLECSEETVKTRTAYGEEHVLYATKPSRSA